MNTLCNFIKRDPNSRGEGVWERVYKERVASVMDAEQIIEASSGVMTIQRHLVAHRPQ